MSEKKPLASRIETRIASGIATECEIDSLKALKDFAWSVTEAKRIILKLQDDNEKLLKFTEESVALMKELKNQLEALPAEPSPSPIKAD